MFRRILLWFTGMVALSFVGFLLTNLWTGRGGPDMDMIRRLTRYQLRELVESYQSGGAPAVQKTLARINQEFPAQHYLLNSKGIDLATGEDRSALLRETPPRSHFPIPPSRLLFQFHSPDGKYIFLIDAGYVHKPLANLAVYGWIVVAIVLVCYVLAWTLVKPVQQLHDTVVRFGSGDLASRARFTRRDELGELARAFDNMADRIATLLTAERRLLQDISHELRSPLARLKFALALIPGNADVPAAVTRANREVERLAILIGELLQVTRVEGDPESGNVSLVDLNAFLSGLVENCQIEAQARECSLNLKLHQQLTWPGDRELLHRAVENIVRNAISHSPKGTPVDIELLVDAEDIVIRVRDHGSGVPEGELEKIFRPFYRVEEHRDRNQGGVGLGLAIAQRAIAVHHGIIHARNVEPGLELEIRLPSSAARTEELAVSTNGAKRAS